MLLTFEYMQRLKMQDYKNKTLYFQPDCSPHTTSESLEASCPPARAVSTDKTWQPPTQTNFPKHTQLVSETNSLEKEISVWVYS